MLFTRELPWAIGLAEICQIIQKIPFEPIWSWCYLSKFVTKNIISPFYWTMWSRNKYTIGPVYWTMWSRNKYKIGPVYWTMCGAGKRTQSARSIGPCVEQELVFSDHDGWCRANILCTCPRTGGYKILKRNWNYETQIICIYCIPLCIGCNPNGFCPECIITTRVDAQCTQPCCNIWRAAAFIED